MLKLIENFCGIAEGPAFGDCTKGPIFVPGTIIRPLAGSGAASLIERKTNEHPPAMHCVMGWCKHGRIN